MLQQQSVSAELLELLEVLKQYSLNELIQFYLDKYADGSEFMVLKSLAYFDDADLEETPVLFEQVSWEEIKKNILFHLSNKIRG